MGNIEAMFKGLHYHHRDSLSEVTQLSHLKQQEVLFGCTEAHFTSPEVRPSNLKGLICENEYQLFHNLTAPTQAVLQNNGFALLGG